MEAGVNEKLVPVAVGRLLRLTLLGIITQQQARNRTRRLEYITIRAHRDQTYLEDLEAVCYLLNTHKIDWDDMKALVPPQYRDVGND